MPSSLARTLQLSIRDRATGLKTPLLVPSFSSKAAQDISSHFDALVDRITESFLVSAYDVHYNSLKVPSAAVAEVMFLDSGGYEAQQDHDVSDPLYPSLAPQPWTVDDHHRVLSELNTLMKTIAISFDHPDTRMTFGDQIECAISMFEKYPNLGREILFKPERLDESHLDVPRLAAEARHFAEFDVIGVTETELGRSIVDRMVNIAHLRDAMRSAGIVKPLHIFGSLDPICSTLYFLAGADIFDGLTWLRFSYMDDMTVYHKNHGALKYGIKTNDQRIMIRNMLSNLDYLMALTYRLHRYTVTRQEATLGRHKTFFTTALDDLRTEYGGSV